MVTIRFLGRFCGGDGWRGLFRPVERAELDLSDQATGASHLLGLRAAGIDCGACARSPLALLDSPDRVAAHMVTNDVGWGQA